MSEPGAANRRITSILAKPLTAGFLLTVGGLIAIALAAALLNLSTIVVYIVVALFIALGLDPVVRRLERLGLTRGRGILVVCGGFLLLSAGVLLLVVPTLIAQAAQFVRNLPASIDDFIASDVYSWVQANFGDQIGDLIVQAQDLVLDPGNLAVVGGGVLQVGSAVVGGISGMIIVIVLSLYLLASLKTTQNGLLRLAPARNRESLSETIDEITASVGSYLGGMVVLALFNAVFALVMHLLLGLPFPQLMAVIAFCVTLIPLIGSVAFWVIASALALFTSPLSALVFALAYLVYMQLEAYVLTPRVMSRSIAIPPILVMIGTLVGGTLFGLLGALVAIPVTASILLVVRQTVIPRQDAAV